MQSAWSVREAGVADIEDLIRLRLGMLRAVRKRERLEGEESLVADTRRYLARALPSGRMRAWVAVAGDRVVACSGVLPVERPPTPENRAGLDVYIFNMYTEPEWRGRGVARAIFTELMRFAREQGAGRVMLHTTPEGRSLYESMGFQPNPTALEWTPS